MGGAGLQVALPSRLGPSVSRPPVASRSAPRSGRRCAQAPCTAGPRVGRGRPPGFSLAWGPVLAGPLPSDALRSSHPAAAPGRNSAVRARGCSGTLQRLSWSLRRGPRTKRGGGAGVGPRCALRSPPPPAPGPSRGSGAAGAPRSRRSGWPRRGGAVGRPAGRSGRGGPCAAPAGERFPGRSGARRARGEGWSSSCPTSSLLPFNFSGGDSRSSRRRTMPAPARTRYR